MTEQEWLTTTYPTSLLKYLKDGGKAMCRKLRLYGCGCVRLVWSHLKDPRSERAVEVAELFADGIATNEELKKAERMASQATVGRRTWALMAARATVYDDGSGGFCAAKRKDKLGLIRCVFGNPFHPVGFDPAWRTPSLTAVAQAIYAERRFADMPILADALEEAGCTSADILDHCRNGQEHVRGCWVVDLILGKA